MHSLLKVAPHHEHLEHLPDLPSLDNVGLIELDVLAKRTAKALHHAVPADLTCVTTFENEKRLIVRAAQGRLSDKLLGLRIPVGRGIGGLAVALRRTVWVDDYAGLEATGDYRDLMVGELGVHWAIGVPLMFGGDPLGVLFVGRNHREFDDADVRQVQHIALRVAPMAAASVQMARQVEAARIDERRRLATEIHDHLVPLLFAIGSVAHRARRVVPAEESALGQHLDNIAELASSGNALARSIMRTLGPVRSEQELVQHLRAKAERFSEVTGTSVSVGVSGHPRPLGETMDQALAAAATEALNNVAKHAPSASVVMTLGYGLNDVTLTVQDDGPGLPEGFRLGRITEVTCGEHFGLCNLANRMLGLDGDLDVLTNDDGGVTLRAWLPIHLAGCA